MMCGICYEKLQNGNNNRFTCIQCLNNMCEPCLVDIGMHSDIVTCPYCRQKDYREYLGYYSCLSERVLNEIRKNKRYINKK